MENRIAQTVSKHFKLKEAELTSLFQQEEGKDVKSALSKEIIKEIKAPSVTSGSIHLAMTFA